jgi:hypothetical protein
MTDFSELLDTAEDIVAETETDFVDEYDTELPNHGYEVLMDNAASVGSTLVDIRTSEAADMDVDGDVKTARLEDDIVDVLLAVATITHEHDLAVAEAFEERLSMMGEWTAFQTAMKEMDDPDEDDIRDAMDEHLSDETKERFMENNVGAGTNVDVDGYDHDRTGAAYQ